MTGFWPTKAQNTGQKGKKKTRGGGGSGGGGMLGGGSGWGFGNCGLSAGTGGGEGRASTPASTSAAWVLAGELAAAAARALVCVAPMAQVFSYLLPSSFVCLFVFHWIFCVFFPPSVDRIGGKSGFLCLFFAPGVGVGATEAPAVGLLLFGRKKRCIISFVDNWLCSSYLPFFCQIFFFVFVV